MNKMKFKQNSVDLKIENRLSIRKPVSLKKTLPYVGCQKSSWTPFLQLNSSNE